MKGRRRLPLDQSGEVVHAMSAGREFRGHVLALAVTRRDEAQARLVRRPFGFQAQARDAPAHGGERAEGQGRGWRLS